MSDEPKIPVAVSQSTVEPFPGGHVFHGNQWVDVLASWHDDASYDKLRDPSTPEGKRFGSALDSLPDFSGTVYRGTQISIAQFIRLRDGGRLTLPAHTASSKDLDVALDYVPESAGMRPVLFEMRSRTGKVLLAEQNEVVFRAGTQFSVSKPPQQATVRGKRVWKIALDEVALWTAARDVSKR